MMLEKGLEKDKIEAEALSEKKEVGQEKSKEKAQPETKKAQLVYFLEQFTPIRCNMNVIFLKDYGNMDKYTYLGVNAVLSDEATGVLDDNAELDQMVFLK